MIINTRIISSLLGNIVLYLATAMMIPAVLAFSTITKGSAEFLACSGGLAVLGLMLKRYGRPHMKHMTLKDMFLFTSIVWTSMVLLGAIPLSLVLNISYISACFEAASAVSTTGATVLSDIDNLPQSILLWRSMLQFCGGIGFIAIGIAVLPNLNVGGMKLFQTESSQQSSDKVSPKSKSIAKGILILYLSLFLLTTAVLYLLGMNPFDAVNHAMTSVATGGMSTHTASMDYFNDEIQWAITLVMFISSLPYVLMVTSRGNLKTIFKDAQVRGYSILIAVVTGLIVLSLIFHEKLSLYEAIKIALFNVINILSSTGYTMHDYSGYNTYITIIFLFILPIGACSGSTSGGIKIFRLQIAFTLFKPQIHQLMHPSAIFPQKYNNMPVNDVIVRSIVAFFCAYLMVLVVSCLILTFTGIDTLDAIGISFSCLSNIGPSIGQEFGPMGDFTSLTPLQCIVLSIDMIMGRLEILTVLICFLPSFWRV